MSSKRNRLFGGIRKRSGIRHLISKAGKSHRERRLNTLHLALSRKQLEGTYSPEIAHVVTRRRSSATQAIRLLRVVPSGADNLTQRVVVG